MKKCLIIDEMHLSIIPMLEQAGLGVVYKPELKPEEILQIIHQYAGIIVRSKMKIDATFLKEAKQLQFIGRAGAGMDMLDVEEIEKRNIKIFNAPEGNRDAVAEHVIGMLFAMFNKIHLGNNEISNGIWNREGNRGYELKGKTFSILGYGFMGKTVAKKMQCFDCEILIYDKHKNGFKDGIGRESSIEEIFEKTDVLSVHIPLTPENKFWINREFLSKFKKPIWIINTSRGEVLKLDALIEFIKNEKIRGAALDVLENEKINNLSPEQKLNFEFLVKSDKVLLTPHVAGWTYESLIRINEVLVEKINNSALFK